MTMATLLLDRPDLELRICDGALALYKDERRHQTMPLRLLDRLIVQGARTRLDSMVVMRLIEAGVSIVFLSPRASRQVGIVLGPGHNDVAIRLSQAALVMDKDYCARWAQQLVMAKLRRQHRFLEQTEKRRPDMRKALFDAREGVSDALTKAAQENISCERLLGLEGSAARAYFSGYCALFSPELGFAGRKRRPPPDPVNACLSLAYTMLHFEAVRSAHAAGLDPLLGFYHRPSFGRESLACDLIEPLRPLADAWVLELFGSGRLRHEHFGEDRGACMLIKTGRVHFYSSWEKFARLPRRWLHRQCRLLARQLRQQGELLMDWSNDDEEF